MNIRLAPTGMISKGSVFDVNAKEFERKLKQYDEQLYIKWNPKKNEGYGCWEIRRRPNEKIPVDYAVYQGNLYLRIEYEEIDHIAHVLDAPYLYYGLIDRVACMDTWNTKNWAAKMEYEDKRRKIEHEEKVRKEAVYGMMQSRREIKDLMELLNSGLNPNQIAHHWGRKKR